MDTDYRRSVLGQSDEVSDKPIASVLYPGERWARFSP